MPSYEYSHEHKAFVKECSRCKHVFIGAPTNEESIKIFALHFSFSNGRAQMADGFQSRCQNCNIHRRRQLGVTRTQVEEMFLDQRGMCAICMKDVSITIGASAEFHAHVDHDKTTGLVRALLCGSCNRGLGCFQHNTTFLSKAIRYLTKYNTIVMEPVNG